VFDALDGPPTPAPKARESAPEPDNWGAQDYRAYHAERSGIYEHEAHLSRRQAELRALEDCIAEWIRRRPIDATPAACAGCGKQDIGEHDIRVIEYRSGGNLWAHGTCWSTLKETWTYEADMALHAMGVTKPLGVGEAEKIGKEAAKTKGSGVRNRRG